MCAMLCSPHFWHTIPVSILALDVSCQEASARRLAVLIGAEVMALVMSSLLAARRTGYQERRCRKVLTLSMLPMPKSLLPA